MAEATAETDSGRNDDRESDENAHGWIPQKFPAESTFDMTFIAQPVPGCCALNATVPFFKGCEGSDQNVGTADWIRTSDLLIHNQAL